MCTTTGSPGSSERRWIRWEIMASSRRATEMPADRQPSPTVSVDFRIWAVFSSSMVLMISGRAPSGGGMRPHARQRHGFGERSSHEPHEAVRYAAVKLAGSTVS